MDLALHHGFKALSEIVVGLLRFGPLKPVKERSQHKMAQKGRQDHSGVVPVSSLSHGAQGASFHDDTS